jgi:hypothetical protein
VKTPAPAATSADNETGNRLSIEVEGDDVDAVAPQIPRAESLGPGTRLVVLAGKSRRWLGSLLPARDAPPLAAIGSALLARGYVCIGAGQEGGRAAAWGISGENDFSGENDSGAPAERAPAEPEGSG